MLLTLTTTHAPATDLGYLLDKNPAKVQSFDLSFGAAHVFYPEATEDHCTAALLLDADPVLIRIQGRHYRHLVLHQALEREPYPVSIASNFGSVDVWVTTEDSCGRVVAAEPG